MFKIDRKSISAAASFAAIGLALAATTPASAADKQERAPGSCPAEFKHCGDAGDFHGGTTGSLPGVAGGPSRGGGKGGPATLVLPPPPVAYAPTRPARDPLATRQEQVGSSRAAQACDRLKGKQREQCLQRTQ